MNQKRFDELLRETTEEYNRPPAVPREEMWAAIERRRGRRAKPVKLWRRPAVLAPVAAAALLLLGIGLGRWTAPESEKPAGSGGIVDSAPKPENSYFRVAAERHLKQTETLLTMFVLDGPATEGSNREKRVYDWAHELLDDTRLLLDSPAAEDPALAELLSDLEFYLVRIVRASGGRVGDEADRINEDLRDQGVLMRLRSQLPAGHV